jgi:cold shock CspA family protein
VIVRNQFKPLSVVGTPMRGRIKRLVRGEGSGIIRTSRGDAFFHKSAAAGAFWTLNVGDDVTFDWLDDAISGPRAQNVRPRSASRRGSRKGATVEAAS